MATLDKNLNFIWFGDSCDSQCESFSFYVGSSLKSGFGSVISITQVKRGGYVYSSWSREKDLAQRASWDFLPDNLKNRIGLENYVQSGQGFVEFECGKTYIVRLEEGIQVDIPGARLANISTDSSRSLVKPCPTCPDPEPCECGTLDFVFKRADEFENVFVGWDDTDEDKLKACTDLPIALCVTGASSNTDNGTYVMQTDKKIGGREYWMTSDRLIFYRDDLKKWVIAIRDTPSSELCPDCIGVTITNRHSSIPPHDFEGRYEWDGTMQHGAKVYAHTVHGTKTTYSSVEGFNEDNLYIRRNTYYFWSGGNVGWASNQHPDGISSPPCIVSMYDGGNLEVVSCDGVPIQESTISILPTTSIASWQYWPHEQPSWPDGIVVSDGACRVELLMSTESVQLETKLYLSTTGVDAFAVENQWLFSNGSLYRVDGREIKEIVDCDAILPVPTPTPTPAPPPTPAGPCADCIEATLINRLPSAPANEIEGRYEWDGTMQHGAKVYAHTVSGARTTYSNVDGFPIYSSKRNTYHLWNAAGDVGWVSSQHADGLREPPCITAMYDGGNLEVVSCDGNPLPTPTPVPPLPKKQPVFYPNATKIIGDECVDSQLVGEYRYDGDILKTTYLWTLQGFDISSDVFLNVHEHTMNAGDELAFHVTLTYEGGNRMFSAHRVIEKCKEKLSTPHNSSGTFIFSAANQSGSDGQVVYTAWESHDACDRKTKGSSVTAYWTGELAWLTRVSFEREYKSLEEIDPVRRFFYYKEIHSVVELTQVTKDVVAIRKCPPEDFSMDYIFSPNGVDEYSPYGHSFATFVVESLDSPKNQGITYSLVSGVGDDNNDWFYLNGVSDRMDAKNLKNWSIHTNTRPNKEGEFGWPEHKDKPQITYSAMRTMRIRVRATAPGGYTEKAFVIPVNYKPLYCCPGGEMFMPEWHSNGNLKFFKHTEITGTMDYGNFTSDIQWDCNNTVGGVGYCGREVSIVGNFDYAGLYEYSVFYDLLDVYISRLEIDIDITVAGMDGRFRRAGAEPIRWWILGWGTGFGAAGSGKTRTYDVRRMTGQEEIINFGNYGQDRTVVQSGQGCVVCPGNSVVLGGGEGSKKFKLAGPWNTNPNLEAGKTRTTDWYNFIGGYGRDDHRRNHRPYNINKIEVKFYARPDPSYLHTGVVKQIKAWGIKSCQIGNLWSQLPC